MNGHPTPRAGMTAKAGRSSNSEPSVATVIQDVCTVEIRGRLAAVATMTEDEAVDAKRVAAGDFAAYTLWRRKPVEHQGDRDARAWAIRDQRGSAAAELWLAAAVRIDELVHGGEPVTASSSIWRPERCAGRGGGCDPGRDPADVAMQDGDGLVPDLVSCDDPAPGLCWWCLSDLLAVLFDVPCELSDLDVGISRGIPGSAAARRELERALEAFAGWLEILPADLPAGAAAAVLAPTRETPMGRHAVMAVVVSDHLYANVDELELRGLARDVSAASVRARAVIFIPLAAQ